MAHHLERVGRMLASTIFALIMRREIKDPKATNKMEFQMNQDRSANAATSGIKWFHIYVAAVLLGTGLAMATIAIGGNHLASTGATARLKERCAGTWCEF